MGAQSLERIGWSKKSALATVLILLAACSTPAYVDESKDAGATAIWPNKVSFKREADTVHADCVTVPPIIGDFDGKVTDAFRRYMAVRTQIQDGCPLVLEGSVTENRSTNIAVASRVAVGAKVDLNLDGAVVWRAEHIASTWGGGLPLDPISAVTTLVSAFDNNRDEQIDRVVNDAVRRIVSTMPRILPDEGPHFTVMRPIAIAAQVIEPLFLKTSFAVTAPIARSPISAGDRAFNLGVKAFDGGDRPQAVRFFHEAALSYLSEGQIDRAEHATMVIRQIASEAR